MNTSSTLSSGINFDKLARSPKTGTPRISQPCFFFSSSRKPTGTYLSEFKISLTNNSPAFPAPNISTRFPASVDKLNRLSFSQRYNNRIPAKPPINKMGYRTSVERGTPSSLIQMNKIKYVNKDPKSTDCMIRVKSGKDAKRQIPRYKPKYQ